MRTWGERLLQANGEPMMVAELLYEDFDISEHLQTNPHPTTMASTPAGRDERRKLWIKGPSSNEPSIAR